MDSAFNHTKSILLNGGQMIVATTAFAVLAFIMWSVSRKRGSARVAGNIMLISAMPGLLASVVTFAMWLFVFITCKSQISAGTFEYVDFSEKYSMFFSVPSALNIFTMFVFPLLSIIAIICGILFITKKASKVLGVISIVFGGITLIFFGLLLLVFAVFWFDL